VINPWLTVNGLGDWRTLEKIAAEATRGCTTDAEKARAIWEWGRKHRYHACTWDGECDDAVKVHNVYGYTLCGDDAIIIDDMFRAAGLKTRPGRPVGQLSLLVEDSNRVLPRLFESAAGLGVRITSVSIQEPNLEAVFLHLTGRALRDE
jgi:transglutaminase-like putative cysteine protease